MMNRRMRRMRAWRLPASPIAIPFALALAFAVAAVWYMSTRADVQIAWEPTPAVPGHLRLIVALVSIDPVSSLATYRITARAQPGKPLIVLLEFFSDGWSTFRTVQLAEQAAGAAASFPEDAIPPRNTALVLYASEVRVAIRLSRHWFPLDTLDLGVGIHTSLADTAGATPPGRLTFDPGFYVASFVPDRELIRTRGTAPDSSRHFVGFGLRRDRFLLGVAALLLVVALVSSTLIILAARANPVNVSLLAYFAGLWTARDIILTPLVSYRPFPSLVDIGVISLFLYTVMGIAGARLLALRAGKPGALHSGVTT
jgi:hypothetical protein